MLRVKFTFKIQNPDDAYENNASYLTFNTIGLGKTIAECRRDAQKQAHTFKRSLRVYETSTGAIERNE